MRDEVGEVLRAACPRRPVLCRESTSRRRHTNPHTTGGVAKERRFTRCAAALGPRSGGSGPVAGDRLRAEGPAPRPSLRRAQRRLRPAPQAGNRPLNPVLRDNEAGWSYPTPPPLCRFSPIEWKNVILYGEIKIDPAKLKRRSRAGASARGFYFGRCGRGCSNPGTRRRRRPGACGLKLRIGWSWRV